MTAQYPHVLKTWPDFFDLVRQGKKTCELRRDDRCFVAGDECVLQEWDPHEGRATGRTFAIEITHVLYSDPTWGLMDGFVALSFKPLAAGDPEPTPL